jgi:hypothetical protein
VEVLRSAQIEGHILKESQQSLPMDQMVWQLLGTGVSTPLGFLRLPPAIGFPVRWEVILSHFSVWLMW